MAGIPALKTSIKKLKKFLPCKRKVSIVRHDPFTGEIVDCPTEENTNGGGILLIPEIIENDYEWERYTSIRSDEVPNIQGFDRDAMTLEIEPYPTGANEG